MEIKKIKELLLKIDNNLLLYWKYNSKHKNNIWKKHLNKKYNWNTHKHKKQQSNSH